MKRNTIILAYLISFVMYLVIAIAVPFNHYGGFWLSVLFTVMAFVVCAFVTFYFTKDSEGVGIVFNISIVRNAIIYLIIQCILSFIVMAISSIPIWISVIIYAFILICFLVLVLGTDFAKDRTKVISTERKIATTNLRNESARISAIRNRASSADVKSCLNNVYEKLRYSDPIGNSSTESIEKDIVNYISSIENEVINNHDDMVKELSEQIINLINERNDLCKNNK